MTTLLPYMNSRDHAAADREREAGRLSFFREVKCAAKACVVSIPKQFTYCSEACHKLSVVVAPPVLAIEDVFADYFDDDEGLGEAPL